MAQEYTVGIDLGGTKILAAVIDPAGQVLGRAKKKTRGELGQWAIAERIVRTAREAIKLAGVDAERITALGIGAPGPIDSTTGIITEAPNLGFKNMNMKDYLERALGITSFVMNDVNVGTWGEYKMGAGHGASSCLGVFVGTGIGSGIVIDGKLYEGAGHVAGEIGHMCLNPEGPKCGCGRAGCLEAYASRTAITREIWTALNKGTKSSPIQNPGKKDGQIRSGRLKEAYDKGDKLVTRVIHHAAEYLGIGLASAASLLNPETIVLGGGVMTAMGAPYLDIVRDAMKAHAFASTFNSTRLVAATLGDDAGVLGAALLARQYLHEFAALERSRS